MKDIPGLHGVYGPPGTPSMPYTAEMDVSQWYRYEMGNGHGKVEMDGQGKVEADSRAVRDDGDPLPEEETLPQSPADQQGDQQHGPQLVYSQKVVIYQRVSHQR